MKKLLLYGISVDYGNICGGSLMKLEILRQSLSSAASVMSVKSD